jgi:hypothetical protein
VGAASRRLTGVNSDPLLPITAGPAGKENRMSPNVQTSPRRRLSPQCDTVLRHLLRAGSITGVEAASVHRIRALPRRIADHREAGYVVRREQRQDVTGQRYVRYFLNV